MKSFEELGLADELLKAVKELGFENPMPVQEEVIPYLLSGDNDIVALAQTGTGKTAAFGLPLLQKIDAVSSTAQALILSPTRELCMQISEDLKDVLPSVLAKLSWLDKEDIIKRLVSLEFKRFIEYYQDDEDFSAATDPAAGKKSGKVEVQMAAGFAKLFINVGKMDGVGPKELLGIINGCIRREIKVGRIDSFTRYTLFDVKEEDAADVTEELNTLKIHGRPVRVTPATEEQINRGRKPKKKKTARQ